MSSPLTSSSAYAANAASGSSNYVEGFYTKQTNGEPFIVVPSLNGLHITWNGQVEHRPTQSPEQLEMLREIMRDLNPTYREPVIEKEKIQITSDSAKEVKALLAQKRELQEQTAAQEKIMRTKIWEVNQAITRQFQHIFDARRPDGDVMYDL